MITIYNYEGTGIAATYKSIKLKTGTNANNKAPEFTDFSEKNGLSVSGLTDNGNERVQVFLNNKFAEQALQFVGEVVSNSSGNWTLQIPSGMYVPGENNFYIATATDAAGNTSEFSNAYMAGNYPMICYVTNTNQMLNQEQL